MSTSTEATVTWAQALAWRMQRQLLEPVGELSVDDVVERLCRRRSRHPPSSRPASVESNRALATWRARLPMAA
jgi:hypothetical protein